jgi:hypothetical protein
VLQRPSQYSPTTHSQCRLTGALGLIITLGGSWPWRLGVPGPPALGAPPPILLNRSGFDIVLCPGFSELIDPDCGCRAGLDDDGFEAPPSFGGRGLLRGSFSAVVEEDGVATGDCAASLELPCNGEEVPSLDSLFLDLEDLFGSFARESCSC